MAQRSATWRGTLVTTTCSYHACMRASRELMHAWRGTLVTTMRSYGCLASAICLAFFSMALVMSEVIELPAPRGKEGARQVTCPDHVLMSRDRVASHERVVDEASSRDLHACRRHVTSPPMNES